MSNFRHVAPAPALASITRTRIDHVLLTLSFASKLAPAAIRAWAVSGHFASMSGVMPTCHRESRGTSREREKGLREQLLPTPRSLSQAATNGPYWRSPTPGV